MFEFLFKVSLQELLGAELQFAWPLTVLLLAVLGGMAGALLCSGYFTSGREFTLMFLRAGLAAVLVLMLAKPQLLLPRADSTSGSIAVLVDDSASMTIADGPAGVSRAQAVRDQLTAGRGALARALEARFDVRHMRFDARLRDGLVDDGVPVGDSPRTDAATMNTTTPTIAAHLTSDNAVSDPLGAMIDALASGDVSAVVLVSDGGQVSGVDERAMLARLRAYGVAVHVLGVGDAQLAPDVGLQAVVVPPSVLNDDEVDVRVELSATDFEGEQLNLTVSDNGALAGEHSVLVDEARFRRSLRIPIRVHEVGLRRIEVRVSTPPGDRVAANNSFLTLLKVRSQAVKVLHFEAEPRFEVKFLRRALADDAALSLSSLVRTGDNRFLRLGIGTQKELADGFPVTAEELFRYHVLIIGSVAVATFSEQQLHLLERFVSVRGGSVLFLGGRSAFAEGGWDASTISRLLPVVLEPARAPFNVAARAVVTAAGLEHAVTRDLFDGRSEEQALTLPALAMVNPIRAVKRGASVLLRGDDGSAEPLVMLAWQRFGAGRVAVLPVRDSWRWRMHADVPSSDRTHELFWRRLVRWLAREVPSQVSARAIPALAAPGQAVSVQVTVRDEQWQAVNDARARVQISTPLGDIAEPPLSRDERAEQSGQSDGHDNAAGIYAARYLVRDTGVYEVHVSDERGAEHANAALGGDSAAAMMVSASGEEFVAPALREERLRRIASASGGSYQHLSQAGDLVERIARSVPVVQSWHPVPLWNAPILLVIALILACSEWWLRRRRRQLP